jgi:hypothetical protein
MERDRESLMSANGMDRLLPRNGGLA